MKYNVKINYFSDLIEEEIGVSIDGIELVCFSNFHTPKMKIGNIYIAELDLFMNDDYSISESEKSLKTFSREGDSFNYQIIGKLENGILDAGIKLKIDTEYLDGYWHLDGRYIVIKGIDRIDIVFLNED